MLLFSGNFDAGFPCIDKYIKQVNQWSDDIFIQLNPAFSISIAVAMENRNKLVY